MKAFKVRKTLYDIFVDIPCGFNSLNGDI